MSEPEDAEETTGGPDLDAVFGDIGALLSPLGDPRPPAYFLEELQARLAVRAAGKRPFDPARPWAQLDPLAQTLMRLRAADLRAEDLAPFAPPTPAAAAAAAAFMAAAERAAFGAGKGKDEDESKGGKQ